ncbi:unnamed protein product, partial [Rotaria sp. Silwood2]
MFTFRRATLICFLLLVLSQLTGGLTCYQCTNNCNDPFNPKNIQQITVADDQGYTCAV